MNKFIKKEIKDSKMLELPTQGKKVVLFKFTLLKFKKQDDAGQNDEDTNENKDDLFMVMGRMQHAPSKRMCCMANCSTFGECLVTVGVKWTIQMIDEEVRK